MNEPDDFLRDRLRSAHLNLPSPRPPYQQPRSPRPVPVQARPPAAPSPPAATRPQPDPQAATDVAAAPVSPQRLVARRGW